MAYVSAGRGAAEQQLAAAAVERAAVGEPADERARGEQRDAGEHDGDQQRVGAEHVRQHRHRAPSVKAANDEPAAVHGEGRSSGSTPSSSRACTRQTCSGSRQSCRATSAAVALVDAPAR